MKYIRRRYFIFKLFSFFCFVFVFYNLFNFELYLELTSVYSDKELPNGVWTVGKWIESDNEETLFYFSAFMENDRILVISIVEWPITNRVRCRFLDEDGTEFSTDGYVLTLFDYYKRRYRPAFTYCNLLSGKPLPHAVAIASDYTNTPINYVQVRYARKVVRNFTVCVSPMHSNYNNGKALIEMIELNRILGANYFIFYNFSSHRNIQGILHHYRAHGLVEIVKWDIPREMIFNNMIHYYGQIAAMNDCIYRNKGFSRFIVNQDIDEFIIPRHHVTWNQLISDLPSDSSTYVFRSTIFPNDWADVDERILFGKDRTEAVKFRSVTVLKQHRETRVFPFDQRTKYIARPECIVSSDIHYITKHKAEKSCKNYYVPQSVALVHHYRNKFSYMEHGPGTLDNRINIYRSQLMKRLKHKWYLLNHHYF